MTIRNALPLSGLLLILAGVASLAGAYFKVQTDLYGVAAALVCIGGLFVAFGSNKSTSPK